MLSSTSTPSAPTTSCQTRLPRSRVFGAAGVALRDGLDSADPLRAAPVVVVGSGAGFARVGAPGRGPAGGAELGVAGGGPDRRPVGPERGAAGGAEAAGTGDPGLPTGDAAPEVPCRGTPERGAAGGAEPVGPGGVRRGAGDVAREPPAGVASAGADRRPGAGRPGRPGSAAGGVPGCGAGPSGRAERGRCGAADPGGPGRAGPLAGRGAGMRGGVSGAPGPRGVRVDAASGPAARTRSSAGRGGPGRPGAAGLVCSGARRRPVGGPSGTARPDRGVTPDDGPPSVRGAAAPPGRAGGPASSRADPAADRAGRAGGADGVTPGLVGAGSVSGDACLARRRPPTGGVTPEAGGTGPEVGGMGPELGGMAPASGRGPGCGARAPRCRGIRVGPGRSGSSGPPWSGRARRRPPAGRSRGSPATNRSRGSPETGADPGGGALAGAGGPSGGRFRARDPPGNPAAARDRSAGAGPRGPCRASPPGPGRVSSGRARPPRTSGSECRSGTDRAKSPVCWVGSGGPSGSDRSGRSGRPVVPNPTDGVGGSTRLCRARGAAGPIAPDRSARLRRPLASGGAPESSGLPGISGSTEPGDTTGGARWRPPDAGGRPRSAPPKGADTASGSSGSGSGSPCRPRPDRPGPSNDRECRAAGMSWLAGANRVNGGASAGSSSARRRPGRRADRPAGPATGSSAVGSRWGRAGLSSGPDARP